MATTRTYTRGFAGGQLSAEMFGRIDDGRYQMGAATMRNMIPRASGPARRRPGFAYASTAKSGTRPTRVLSFIFNNDQGVAVHIGANYDAGSGPGGLGQGYMRFHAEGGTLAADTYTAWSSGTAYVIGDCVSNAGVNYYCIFPHSPSATVPGSSSWPTPSARWYPMPAGILEIPTLWDAGDIFDLHFDQSLDVVTFVHPDYFPFELRRLGAGTWTLTTASLGSIIAAPTSPSVAATKSPQMGLSLISHTGSSPGSTCHAVSNHGLANGDSVFLTGTITWTGSPPSGNPGSVLPGDKWWQVQLDSANPLTRFRLVDPETGLLWTNDGSDSTSSAGYIEIAGLHSERTNTYVITAVDSTTNSESVPSAEASAANNLLVEGSYNTVTWSSVTGADPYRVYKEISGLFGFIGETEDTTFRDDNIGPDLSITPPILDQSFGTQNPGAVGHFDQRRFLAGTDLNPMSVWATRTGTENDLTFTLPSKADNRLKFTVSSRRQGAIRHIVPLSQLVLLTSESEIRVTPVNSDVLSPDSIAARHLSHIGSSNVPPIIVDSTVVFCAARGGHIRAMTRFDGSEPPIDLSTRVADLFDDYTIVDSAHMRAPDQILWFVRSDGKLLGFTFAPDEAIAGWHWHDTNGLIKSVCVIPEGGEDRLYAVVQRVINGSTVQYIERMGSLAVNAIEDCFFVDAGYTYDSTSTSSVSGLTWLEAATVQILGDGVILDEATVSSGAASLSTASSTVQIGLGYTSEIVTLPLVAMVDGYGQGRPKNVRMGWVRVYESGAFKFVAPNGVERTAQLAGGSLYSELVEIMAAGNWNFDGQITIRQTEPLPLTVVSLTMEVAFGG